jgi:hypothetical protein
MRVAIRAFIWGYLWKKAGAAAAASSAIGVVLAALSQFLDAFPRLSGGLIGVAGLCFAASIALYLFAPKEGGDQARFKSWWFENRLRRVSWFFDKCLTVRRGNLVWRFGPRFRLNWPFGNQIIVTAAYIECLRTGRRQVVEVEHGNPYLPIEQRVTYRRYADKDTYYSQICWYGKNREEGISTDEFLRLFDGFAFVFEYDDRIFRKNFSRRWLYAKLEGENPKFTPPSDLQTPTIEHETAR